MNRKQLFILVAAAVLIGGLGLITLRRQSASWQVASPTSGKTLLGAFPINDVTQVVIKQSNQELNLVRGDVKGEVTWQVRERNSYPANFGEISELIRKLSDLKPVQQIKVGPSQLGRLELLVPGKGTNSGTLIELKDKNGKILKSLLVGKKHMRGSGDDSPMGMGGGWPDGRYVLVTNAAETIVSLVGDPLANVEPKPESWLNKDFFKVEKLRSISVTPTNASTGWTFSRQTETGDLKLEGKKDTEEPDANKVVSLVNAFSYPSFNDVLPPETQADVTGLDHPVSIRIETFDQFRYDLQLGKPGKDENYHLTMAVTADIPAERVPGKDEKPEDKTKLDKEFKDKNDKLKAKLAQEKTCEKWVYLVSKWTVESMLKDRSHWMVEKKDETKKDGTTSTSSLPAGTDMASPIPPLPGDDDDHDTDE